MHLSEGEILRVRIPHRHQRFPVASARLFARDGDNTPNARVQVSERNILQVMISNVEAGGATVSHRKEASVSIRVETIERKADANRSLLSHAV